jgi:hypothetical protein
MSWWTRSLLEEVVDASGGNDSESVALASRTITDLNPAKWERLRKLRDIAKADGVGLALVDFEDGDLHDYLDDDDAPRIGRYRLRVAKRQPAGVLRFLDSSQARAAAAAYPDVFEKASRLLLADLDEPITGTVGIRVGVWGLNQVDSEPDASFSNPSRLVRDVTNVKVIPTNVSTWLIDQNGHDAMLHPFFGGVATRRLSLCLPSVIEGVPLELSIRIQGRSKMQAVVEEMGSGIWSDAGLYAVANETCTWLYSDKREADNKHTLLVAELARSWPEGAGWGAGLAQCLEDALASAQMAYRLHLQEKGVDALKLMAELRKAVADDVKSVASQTSALSAALWRDAAVALGAVALRNAGTVSDVITCLVALYLSIGATLTLRWANGAVEAIANNELAFRKTLYKPIMADNSYKNLALVRYEEVFEEYKKYRNMVAVVYIFAITGLLWSVYWPLWHSNILRVVNSILELTGLPIRL